MNTKKSQLGYNKMKSIEETLKLHSFLGDSTNNKFLQSARSGSRTNQPLKIKDSSIFMTKPQETAQREIRKDAKDRETPPKEARSKAKQREVPQKTPSSVRSRNPSYSNISLSTKFDSQWERYRLEQENNMLRQKLEKNERKYAENINSLSRQISELKRIDHLSDERIEELMKELCSLKGSLQNIEKAAEQLF